MNSIVCIGISPPWYDSVVFVSVGKQESARVPTLRIATQPVVLVVDSMAPGGINSIDGGYSVVLTGDGFGSEPRDIVRVTVGGVSAPHVAWNSSSLLSVTVPPGIGLGRPVVVERRDRLRSAPLPFSYAQPEVYRTRPSFLLPGVGNATIALVGSNLANSPADVQRLAVGNYPCRSIVPVNTSYLECNLVGVDLWTSSAIVLTDSSGATHEFEGVFTGLPEPRVTRSRPSVAAAGDTVQVIGSNFAPAVFTGGTTVTEVWFGTTLSPSFSVLDSDTIEAVVPDGVGSGIHVVVVVESGRRSAPQSIFSYSAPTLHSIHPLYIMSGETNMAVRVEGANFGFDVARPPDVWVAQVAGSRETLAPCTGDLSFDPAVQAVNCTVAGTGDLLAGTASIRVRAGGQENGFQTLNRIDVVGRPSVDFISPSVGGNRGGDVVTLTGSGFGWSPDDVVSVTMGGVTVRSFQWQAPTLISMQTLPGVGPNIGI